MEYILFDLEWNQPSDESAAVREPIYLSGEILQIGAVKLNEAFEPVDELRLYVTPHFYTKLHKQVAALTGIREADLREKGVSFPEAYAKFAAWCGETCVWMTWSTSDLPILLENMLMHGLDVTNLPDYCDVQRIFSREIMRGQTRYSLDTALAILKEKGDSAHDALHDARNTAKVCNHLDLEQYLWEYTGRIYGEVPKGRIYESKGEMLADAELRAFCCPLCGSKVSCEDWVCAGHSTYLGYGLCPEEDEFLVQLTAEFQGSGRHSAKRILFELTDDLWDIYMDKKEAAQGVLP